MPLPYPSLEKDRALLISARFDYVAGEGDEYLEAANGLATVYAANLDSALSNKDDEFVGRILAEEADMRLACITGPHRLVDQQTEFGRTALISLGSFITAVGVDLAFGNEAGSVTYGAMMTANYFRRFLPMKTKLAERDGIIKGLHDNVPLLSLEQQLAEEQSVLPKLNELWKKERRRSALAGIPFGVATTAIYYFIFAQ